MSRAAVAAVAALLLLLPASASGRDGPVELGAAINDAGFAFGGDAYRDTFAANYGAATAESAMKMTALQPSQGQFEFGQADAIVDWARSRGKQVHGHVLVWCADEWNPSWVTERSWTREELLAVMEEHIRTVVDHFEGRVATWDVVNEALAEDGTRKDCVWQRTIGDDWVEQAFRFARAADPSVRLFYNEWAADFPNPKFEGLVKLVGTLPLDGVGLQNHTYGYAPYQYDVEDAIGRLGALGLDVHVSELNVTTSQIGGDLARQAQAYRTIAAACQAEPACFRVTTWGFTDAYGWRPPSEKAMPFDVEYAPKPAWAALQRALGRAAGPSPAVAGPPSAGAAVGQGAVPVSWPGVDGATFTLQHRDAGTAGWRTVASGIPGTSFDMYEFREGTWSYRVRAEDGPWTEASPPVVVDRTPPPAPTVAPGAPWLREGATARLSAVDPPLPDGSAGSGVVEPAGTVFAATGELRGTVTDRAGNVSPEGGGVVSIDASAPRVGLACPEVFVRGSRTSARWTASDEGSGLAGPAAGGTPVRLGRCGGVGERPRRPHQLRRVSRAAALAVPPPRGRQ